MPQNSPSSMLQWHPVPGRRTWCFRYAAVTDIGCKRAANEDNYFADPATGLFVVADGMGGHAGGAFASWLTSQQIGTVLRELRLQADEELDVTREPDYDPEVPRTIGIEAYYGVWRTQAVLRAAMERDVNLLHMGATLVGLCFENDGVHVIHLGDSRAYAVVDGALHLLTEDHATTRTIVVAGATRARRMLTRVVGGLTGESQPDLAYCKVAPKHRFLLCTDGVWEPLTPDEILAAVHDSDPAEACDALVQLALARGGRDNLTTLIVEIADARALAAEAAARDEDTIQGGSEE